MNLGHAKEDGGCAVKTEVKIKTIKPKSKMDLRITPERFFLEKECKPDRFNNGDNSFSLVHSFTHHPLKNCFMASYGFKYGIPKLHDSLGVFLSGNANWCNTCDWTGDFAAMLALNDKFFVGSKIVTNMKTKKTEEITGISAADLDGHYAYLHTDCLKHKMRVGLSSTKVEHFTKVAGEAQIDLDNKGSFQDKTTANVAFDYPLNKDTRIKMKFDLAKNIFAHFSFIHKISKHHQITVTDYANPVGFFTNPAKEKYVVGVAFEANY